MEVWLGSHILIRKQMYNDFTWKCFESRYKQMLTSAVNTQWHPHLMFNLDQYHFLVCAPNVCQSNWMDLTYCISLLIKSHLRVIEHELKTTILFIECFMVQFILEIALVANCSLGCWKAAVKSGRCIGILKQENRWDVCGSRWVSSEICESPW